MKKPHTPRFKKAVIISIILLQLFSMSAFAKKSSPEYIGVSKMEIPGISDVGYENKIGMLSGSDQIDAAEVVYRDTIGLYDPDDSKFFLRNSLDGGVANYNYVFGPGGMGWQPVTGDWDNNGTDTIGLYNPSNSNWYLRNSHSGGAADSSFRFGPAGMGWIPIAGDWNNNDTDTIGFYSPTTSKFYLRNSLSGGAADVVFRFGPAGMGWLPIVGDWDDDGVDEVGLYSPTTSKFYLRYTHTAGAANIVFRYGAAGAGWLPIAGDWNNNGKDTVGLYNPNNSKWYLRNSNSSGTANYQFKYGPSGLGWEPLAGNWNGSGGQQVTCYYLTRSYTGEGSAPTASPTNSSGCSSGYYTASQAITLTPHPDQGWGLDYWTGSECSSCPFLTMPASARTVTAHYEQTNPTTLRIINDLESRSGWDFYNSLLWIRTAASCGDFSFDGFAYPSGGTEYLWPLDFTYDTEDTERLPSNYLCGPSSGSCVKEIDVSGIPLAPDGSYCVLIEAGWWDYVMPGIGSNYWEKRPTAINCCNGSAGCYKWATIQIIKPYFDPEEIYVSDFLPHLNTWQGHPMCQ